MRRRWRTILTAVLLILPGLAVPLTTAFAASTVVAGPASHIRPPVVLAGDVTDPLPRITLPPGLPHTQLPLPDPLAPKAAHQFSAAAGGLANTSTSANWAGYAASVCDVCALRYAAATWTVPDVNCRDSEIGSSGYAYDSQWAGLDGFGDSTVEQTGISAYCTSSDGDPSYYAWYEMYPKGPVAFGGISPGDVVSASVFYNAAGDDYQLNLADQTTGASIATTQDCAGSCGNASAEVVTEDPGGAVASGINLADFGRADFSAIRITSRIGVRGGFGASNGLWSSQPVTMAYGADQLAHPEGLNGSGTAFSTVWDASS